MKRLLAAMLLVLGLAACGSDKGADTASAVSGVVLTAGNEGDEWGRTYACAAGLDSVQLPVGNKTERDGSSFSLSEERIDSGFLQETAKLSVKLSTNEGLPVFIVNTKAHSERPDLYPQSALQVGLRPGGEGEFTLRTDTYADNYERQGITDITLCLDRSSGAK